MRLDELTNCIAAANYAAISECKEFTFEKPDASCVLEMAIACKTANALGPAQHLLESLTNRVPEHAAGHYELAVMYRDTKELFKAVHSAETAFKIAPSSFRFNLFYAHMLFANGAWSEGHEQLDRTITYNLGEILELAAMRDFGNYIREFPVQRALHLTSKLRDKYKWNSPSEVIDRIELAIIGKRAFSLIRLGDGDGAHFQVSSEDEARYPNLYKMVRKVHTEFLLGIDIDPVFTGYVGLTSTLAQFVSEADILGVAYPSWIAHEYDTSSPITLTCLMNINRHLYENERIPDLSLCDQLIHMQLHEERLLEPVLQALDSLTVISCLEDLPTRIKAKFGIRSVDLIKIPSETFAPHLYGEVRLTTSLHYPHAFWPAVQHLSQPHNGHVFIIAAGTFGKFYASIIKRHGGIALDLGSLVDGWMGLISRPGYEKFANEAE